MKNKLKIIYLNIKCKWWILKYKWWILNFNIDIILLKIKYLLLTNKWIYKILYFSKTNKTYILIVYNIKFILLLLKTLYKIIKKDYKLLKSNYKKFKLYHRNMFLLIPFYIFFFLAGLIPLIYLIILIYFIIKYSFKYIFICLELYFYYYYFDSIDEKSKINVFAITYKYNKTNILYIFVLVKTFIFKIDKFLFRMERKEKLKRKILLLRISIWNKYVQIAQRYIDKFDDFILLKFPELWYEWEVFLFNSITKMYIYKARTKRIILSWYTEIKFWIWFIKKKIRKFKRFKKKIIKKTIPRYKKFLKLNWKLKSLRCKRIIRFTIYYSKFNLRKYVIKKIYFPLLLLKDYFNNASYKRKFLKIRIKKKIRWLFHGFSHPYFWDYIYILFFPWFWYYGIRSYLYYIFPAYPFFQIVHFLNNILWLLYPHNILVYSFMYIWLLFLHLTYYIFKKIYCYLYKLECYFRNKLFNWFHNIIMTNIQSLFWLIYYYFQYINQKNIYKKIITYILEEPNLSYLRYFGLRRKCMLYLDLCSWRLFWYRRSSEEAVILEYRKYPFIYFIEYRRFIFSRYTFYTKVLCFKNCLVRLEFLPDLFDLYETDLFFHEYYAKLFPFDKYLYKYPTKNMCENNQYWFILKPGNHFISRMHGRYYPYEDVSEYNNLFKERNKLVTRFY